MKRWRVGALLCAAVVCLSMALVGCQQSEYKPEAKEQVISSSALGKAGTLRVGVNAASAPLAGQTSSSSRIMGIDVDVAAYLADQMGVKVEIKDVGNDPSSALKDGDVDVVLGVDASDSDVDFWKSSSYLSTGVALFGAPTESSAPLIDSNPKIAAQGSSKSSWRVSNLYGDASLVVQNDLKSAFDVMEQGTDGVKYVAADAVIGTYVAYSNGYSTKIVALLQEPSGYCAAVASSNTELQNAVTSAMSTLVDGGVIDVIEKKWLGTSLSLKSVTIVKSANADASASASAAAANPDASASSAAAQPAEGEQPAEAPAEQAPEGEAAPQQ